MDTPAPKQIYCSSRSPESARSKEGSIIRSEQQRISRQGASDTPARSLVFSTEPSRKGPCAATGLPAQGCLEKERCVSRVQVRRPRKGEKERGNKI
ncbi:hypothetical protein MRX96_055825 [Rhipicephalus microplus]